MVTDAWCFKLMLLLLHMNIWEATESNIDADADADVGAHAADEQISRWTDAH